MYEYNRWPADLLLQQTPATRMQQAKNMRVNPCVGKTSEFPAAAAYLIQWLVRWYTVVSALLWLCHDYSLDIFARAYPSQNHAFPYWVCGRDSGLQCLGGCHIAHKNRRRSIAQAGQQYIIFPDAVSLAYQAQCVTQSGRINVLFLLFGKTAVWQNSSTCPLDQPLSLPLWSASLVCNSAGFVQPTHCVT